LEKGMSQHFCTACGAALRPNANFCGTCGMAVVGAGQKPPAAAPPLDRPPAPPAQPPAPPPVAVPAPQPPAPPPRPAAPAPQPAAPPPPPQPAAPYPQPGGPAAAPLPPAFDHADWSSLEVQPGETAIDSWLVGLIGRGPGVSGILTVTNRRILFKPKVAGTSLAGMLISQLPQLKERNRVVLGKDQIVAVSSEKGLINTRITITAANGEIFAFNRGVASADPILAAIGHGRTV
jgi:hypothetical protein